MASQGLSDLLAVATTLSRTPQDVTTLAPPIGIAAASAGLGLPRASFYRQRGSQAQPVVARPRRASARALGANERQALLDPLRSDRFVHLAPAEVYASLLDEGTYLCSIRTMYRILDSHTRNPSSWPSNLNEVWSWHITKLLGPAEWRYFHLYVIIDIRRQPILRAQYAPDSPIHLRARLTRSLACGDTVELRHYAWRHRWRRWTKGTTFTPPTLVGSGSCALQHVVAHRACTQWHLR